MNLPDPIQDRRKGERRVSERRQQCTCPQVPPITVGIWTARYRDPDCPVHQYQQQVMTETKDE